jgi:hypothetical protein
MRGEKANEFAIKVQLDDDYKTMNWICLND